MNEKHLKPKDQEIDQKLLLAEHFSALGKMFSHVAHEVRNPLSSIRLNLDLLRDICDSATQALSSKEKEEVHSFWDTIDKELDRIEDIVNKHLRLSRVREPKKEPANLNDVVEEVLFFLKEEARVNGIQIYFHKSPELASFLIDPQQIQQVLLNLIRNAFEAMPSGGRIRIKISEEQDAVAISVRDYGSGMDEEVRRRIFEPFFTTKSYGTGLGLSVVQQIMADHNGTVDCESQKGVGTTFYLKFPRVFEGPSK